MRPAATPSQADDEGDDEDDARFSDDGEADAPGPPVDPVAEANDDFDFSGTLHAGQHRCPFCNKTFEVTWSAERKQLVHEDAVKLRGSVYHLHCVLLRRGPGDEPRRSERW